MKTYLKPLFLFSSCALAAISTLNAGAPAVVATDPVGYVTVTVDGDTSYNFVALPLVNSPDFSGQAASVGATTVTVAGTPWAPGDYDSSYFVEITSNGGTDGGDAKGLLVDVVSNTANELTLADDVSSFTFEGDETFTIREHETIGSVFGVNNSAGLQGGTGGGSSDEILLWNPVSQGFSSYFYNVALTRWAPTTNPFGADASGEILYPDQGVVILRKAAGQASFVVAGAVKVGQTQAPVFTGFNFYDNKKPYDTTLGATGWQNDLVGGTGGGSSDEIGIWNATTQTLDNYFYNTALSRWAPTTNPFGADASSVVVPANSSVLINKKSGTTTLTETAISL